jgi:hypothetical protein
MRFKILKTMFRRFLWFRVAKLGCGEESGGARSNLTAKVGYNRIPKGVGFL